MLQGKPQKLISKFKISFQLLLNLISIGDINFTQFAKRSMIQEEIDLEMNQLQKQINELSVVNNVYISTKMQTPLEIIQEYIELTTNVKNNINKKKREMEKRIEELKYNHRFIDTDKIIVEKYQSKLNEIIVLKKTCEDTNQYLNSCIQTILNLLENDNFITTIPEMALTYKGTIACQLREVHCLVFAELLEDNLLYNLSSRQLIGLFSCLTNCNVPDEYKSILPKSEDVTVQNIVNKMRIMYDDYLKKEEENQVNTGIDYKIHYDLIDYCMRWCDCENVLECKLLLQSLEQNKQVGLGEFVKSLLKINNISSEMEKIAESCGNVAFLSKLKEIHVLTMKFVVTNQSLYV